MRTSKKYLDLYKRLMDGADDVFVTGKDFKEAINEARKDIVEEILCHYVQDGNPQVWRDKILSLLKEIK